MEHKRYVIDRFEGTLAITQDEDGVIFDFLRDIIPPEAVEGDVIFLEGNLWQIDEQETARRRAIAAERSGALREE